MIKFKVPMLPPSVNLCYYTNKYTGARHKSKTYRDFIKSVEHWLPSETLEGEVHVEYNFGYPLLYKNGNRRKMDMGNLEKALTDTLVHYGIIEDDCWIRRLTLESYDSFERETWIQITPYNNGNKD